MIRYFKTITTAEFYLALVGLIVLLMAFAMGGCVNQRDSIEDCGPVPALEYNSTYEVVGTSKRVLVKLDAWHETSLYLNCVREVTARQDPCTGYLTQPQAVACGKGIPQ